MTNSLVLMAILISLGTSAKAEPLRLYPMGEEREPASMTGVHRSPIVKKPKSIKKTMARAKSTQGRQVIEFKENEVKRPQQIKEELPENLEQAMREHARRPSSTGFFILDEESAVTSK